MKRTFLKKMTLLLTTLTFGAMLTASAAPGAKPEVLDQSNFTAKTATGVVMIDFYADWCGPCRRQAPIIEKVIPQLPAGVKIVKVNVDKSRALSRTFRVRSIPCWVVLKNGKEIYRFTGLRDENFLLQTARRFAK